VLTKDGSAGLITFKGAGGGAFTLNHHACVLKLKDKWIKKVDLEWFALQYRTRLVQYATSRSDNMVFSTKWFDRVPFEVPDDIEAQRKLKNRLLLLDRLTRAVEELQYSINDVRYRSKLNVDGTPHLIKDIFTFHAGNSGLTAEFVYNNQPASEEESVPIYSGATKNLNLLGRISRSAQPSGKKLKVFEGPCVLVSRKGYAGTMMYLSAARFAANDDAYVLTLKSRWVSRMNLRWFAFQYQERFLNLVTSRSDNSTFNKDNAQRQSVIVPGMTYQDRIAVRLAKLDGAAEMLGDVLRVAMKPYGLSAAN